VIFPPRLNYEKLEFKLTGDEAADVEKLVKRIDDYTSGRFEEICCDMLKNEVLKSEDNAFIFFGPQSDIASDGQLGKIT
jgi:hypothetical protein